MTQMTMTTPSQMDDLPVVPPVVSSGMSMSWSSRVEMLLDDDVREKLAAAVLPAAVVSAVAAAFFL